MKLVLTGHYAGKSVVLNGYEFKNGEMELPGDVAKMAGLVSYFASYNAFLSGSAELAAAQKRDRENKNGRSADLEGRKEGSSGVSTDEPGPEKEPGGSGHDDPSASGSGSVSEGNGVQAGRDGGSKETVSNPRTLKIIDALNALDAGVEEHWTPAGQPKVQVIAEATSLPDLTRKEIDAALPGFNRKKAIDSQI